jgi:hypothetical protein
MEIKNAIIKNAKITTDNGFLDCWLELDYGGTCQGFGGYVLYLPKTYTHHSISSHAGHFIFRCMEVAGVATYDQLKGKSIRVKGNFAGIEAIGHIINDDWFCPKKDFDLEKDNHK